jgi:hypothetical protein
MKKKFVFWIARRLGVKIFEKETTEIIHRTTHMKFSRIEIKKKMPFHEVEARRRIGASFSDLRNELVVELANKLINEGKVTFETFEDQISQIRHFRIYIEAADQENNER